MNVQFGENTTLSDKERDYLTIDEAVKALWEWRKYRNEVFWNSVYRWALILLGMTIIPYMLPDIIRKLGIYILIFPILAFFISVFAAYLLAVQYKLYKQVDAKFKSLLGNFKPEDIPNKPINRLFRIAIGKVVVIVFLTFGIVFELISGLILSHLIPAI